jgi:hypothetical protein
MRMASMDEVEAIGADASVVKAEPGPSAVAVGVWDSEPPRLWLAAEEVFERGGEG